jgi:hypothetical protein
VAGIARHLTAPKIPDSLAAFLDSGKGPSTKVPPRFVPGGPPLTEAFGLAGRQPSMAVGDGL